MQVNQISLGTVGILIVVGLIFCCSHSKQSVNTGSISNVTLKVSGMRQKGGFTWLGWPDAIVSALEGLKGIKEAEYKVNEDLFYIAYNAKQITIEGINEKIRQVGEEQKMPYKPHIVKPDKLPITFELKPWEKKSKNPYQHWSQSALRTDSVSIIPNQWKVVSR